MMPNRIKNINGFIFDFDGTIIVSEHVHMLAWEDLARAVGLELPAGYLEQSVGLSDLELIKILAKAWRNQLSQSEILSRKRAFYMSRAPSECSEVPGVVSLIRRIHATEAPIAVATSSSREEVFPVLERLKIKDCFRSVVTVDDVTKPKPDPEIYFKAAANLGLTPEVCVAFEDSKAGVESARRAGCILVTLQTLYDANTLGSALLSGKDFQDDKILAFMDSVLDEFRR